jgi:hypothetical protein
MRPPGASRCWKRRYLRPHSRGEVIAYNYLKMSDYSRRVAPLCVGEASEIESLGRPLASLVLR